MKSVNLIRHSCGAIVLGLVSIAIAPASAADVIAEWATVKPPAAPELKPAKLDGKTTALLILDLQKSQAAPCSGACAAWTPFPR